MILVIIYLIMKNGKKKSQFCNAYVHDKLLYCVLHANMISILEF